MNTLIVVPVKKNMNVKIFDKMIQGVNQIIKHSNASLFLDYRECPPMQKKTPWTKVSWIRNQILDDCLWEKYTHLLWIDADVVEMPETLLEDLITANPEGITAPFVRVDKTNRRAYDWAAFVMAGKSHIQPLNRNRINGRNINPDFPYFEGYIKNSTSLWDCVGTVTLVNCDIYKAGARYEDHPSMTDHFPVCKKCREMDRKVMMIDSVEVAHAFLPDYGEAWH